MTCASMFNNASSCQSLCSLVLPVWPERSVAFDWVRTQKTSCRSKGTPATITRLATKLVLFWHTTVRSISKDFLTNLTVLLLIRIVHGPNELKAERAFFLKKETTALITSCTSQKNVISKSTELYRPYYVGRQGEVSQCALSKPLKGSLSRIFGEIHRGDRVIAHKNL